MEADPFPADPAESRYWAGGVALTDSTVSVLARNRESGRFEVVDEYDLRDCSYLRSMRLPRSGIAYTSREGIVYLAYENPVPGVVALRPRATLR
jgi:hypothetical protein